ncbi:MAG: hypothetical protein GY702_23460 [Desulfobulbaceae bacterium]|nr:hypothetical protein [Desulfobulbaceae bacterium]
MWDDKDNAVPDLEFKSAVEKLLTSDSIVKGLNQNLSYSNYGTNSNVIENEFVTKDVQGSSIKGLVKRKNTSP